MYSINRTSVVPQKCLSCPTLVTNSTKHKNYLNIYHCRWALLLLQVIEMKSYSTYKLNTMCGCELSMLLYAVSYCMNVSKPMHFTVINHSCTFCCRPVTKLCLTLYNPIDGSKPGSAVLHCLLGLAQIHVYWVGNALQPSHPLLPSSPFAFNLSQHQDLFQWVGSSHQVAKVLELQLQHQSFQWIFRTDFL